MTDPVLEAHWKRVLDDWENDAAHGSFLEYCQTSDQLLEAAVRYRGMAGDRTRGPSADKRLSAISLLALSKLEDLHAARSVIFHRVTRCADIPLAVPLSARPPKSEYRTVFLDDRPRLATKSPRCLVAGPRSGREFR
jgi:hypothetical protein